MNEQEKIKKDIDEMIKAIREEDMYVTKFRVHCDKLYEKIEQLRGLKIHMDIDNPDCLN